MMHLIRHGRPLAAPGVARSDWQLDPSAADEIVTLRLALALPDETSWYVSPEARAVETAHLLGAATPVVVADFREQIRPDVWVEDFRRVVERGLGNPRSAAAPGWEPAIETQRRVAAAAAGIKSDGAGPVALVGHGTAWTLLVAALTGTEPDVDAWRELRMPDHCRVDRGTIVAPWGSWA